MKGGNNLVTCTMTFVPRLGGKSKYIHWGYLQENDNYIIAAYKSDNIQPATLSDASIIKDLGEKKPSSISERPKDKTVLSTLSAATPKRRLIYTLPGNEKCILVGEMDKTTVKTFNDEFKESKSDKTPTRMTPAEMGVLYDHLRHYYYRDDKTRPYVKNTGFLHSIIFNNDPHAFGFDLFESGFIESSEDNALWFNYFMALIHLVPIYYEKMPPFQSQDNIESSIYVDPTQYNINSSIYLRKRAEEIGKSKSRNFYVLTPNEDQPQHKDRPQIRYHCAKGIKVICRHDCRGFYLDGITKIKLSTESDDKSKSNQIKITISVKGIGLENKCKVKKEIERDYELFQIDDNKTGNIAGERIVNEESSPSQIIHFLYTLKSLIKKPVPPRNDIKTN